MLVGYMRVSTDGDRQTFDLQRDALLSAGVDERHLFEDRVSGSRGERRGLAKVLAFIKSGDCLVVWKLDRLGRSLPHLLTTVSDLRARGIGFRSLTEQMDTATPQGEFIALINRVMGERVWGGAAQKSKYPPAKPGALRFEPLKAAEDATCVASSVGRSSTARDGKLVVVATP